MENKKYIYGKIILKLILKKRRAGLELAISVTAATSTTFLCEGAKGGKLCFRFCVNRTSCVISYTLFLVFLY
jgi:hypothetical protein